MTFRILPEATDEPFDAALEYERTEPGLGRRFRREVADVIERILFQFFPNYIAYFLRRDTVIVAAVAHAKRNPNYWKRRAKSARRTLS